MSDRASEAAIAASLLAVERRHALALHAAIRIPSDRVAIAVSSSTITPAGALVAIRREADEVEARVYGAVQASRADSRKTSRRAQEAAVAALLLLGRRKGVADFSYHPRTAFHLSEEAIASDAASAMSAARSVAAAWGQTTMASYNRWRSNVSAATRGDPLPTGGPYRTPGARAGGYEDLATEVRKTPKVIEARIDRVNATEIAQAHNEEAKRVVDELPKHIRAAIEYVWSAVNDKRTCPACSSLDGKVSVGGDFNGQWPPAHPLCRCVVYPRRKM